MSSLLLNATTVILTVKILKLCPYRFFLDNVVKHSFIRMDWYDHFLLDLLLDYLMKLYQLFQLTNKM
jgi:hypothetical protein